MNFRSELAGFVGNMGWRKWNVGIYDDGLYFLEYETPEQYDEWQFDDKSSLVAFLKNLCNK